MTMTTFSNPEGVATPIAQYSHVARVDLGDKALLFISGQVAVDREGNLVGAGDAEAQADQVHENLKAIMEAHGGALSDIVKTTVFVTDLSFRQLAAASRKRYFGDAAPTSTLAVISSLATPDYLVEIEAVAVVKNG